MKKVSNHNIPLVRELAEQRSVADLEACLANVIENEFCSCLSGHSPEAAMNVLAMATYVRQRCLPLTQVTLKR